MQDDNDEVQWSTDTSAAAIAARAAEQLSGATAEMVTQGNIEVRIQLKALQLKAHKQHRTTDAGQSTKPFSSGVLPENHCRGTHEVCPLQWGLGGIISSRSLHRYHTAGLVNCLSGTISDATADLRWIDTFAASGGRTSMIPSEHSKNDGTCFISFVLTAHQAASKAALCVSPELVSGASGVVG